MYVFFGDVTFCQLNRWFPIYTPMLNENINVWVLLSIVQCFSPKFFYICIFRGTIAMPRSQRGHVEAKCRNFSLKLKMDVIWEYVPHSKGHGFLAPSKKYGVPHSTIRGWYASKDELKTCLKNKNIIAKKTRRLQEGGRKVPHNAMEDELQKWVLACNEKGLRVKDQ